MIYREVVKVQFENRLYQMYLGENNSRYFLEILPNGNYMYPSLESLLKLEYIFSDQTRYRDEIKRDGANTKNFIPKVLVKGVPVLLVTAMLASGCARMDLDHYPHDNNTVTTQNTSYSENIANNGTSQKLDDVYTDLGFEVADSTEPLDIEKHIHSDRFNYDYIYDVDYYDIAFGNYKVTADMLNKEIDKNSGISSKYKTFLKDYVQFFIKAYPDADLRILYENLKTLEVVECKDKLELMTHTLSADSYACYMRSENKIYTLDGYDYVPGTWDYQIIMHELSHAARTYWRDTDNDGSFNIKVQFEGLGVKPISVSEAINSLFAVRMYDKNERDIAYQLQSNYFDIILECVDNYKLSDYINHSMSYLASKLDEAGGYNNYSMVMFELMESQYKDYHSDQINIKEEEFYPIYDYVANFYFNKYLHAGMSKSDMTSVCDDLVERVTFDVPAEYHIDSNHFYVYLEDYIQSHGLDQNTR